MSKFECCCHCDDNECSRFHNPPQPPCNCIRQISKSTKFIERLLDCTETIVHVLTLCGIHDCKAKAASEVIVFAFLHFDIVPDPVSDVLRKKLHKEDVFHDLGRKCRMNRVEAHLAYSIIKRAFKAFYYKQTSDMYNPNFIDEFQWMRAAQRTAEFYANLEGLSDNERKKLENRIKCSYCSYIERVQEIKRKELEKSCTCCFCNKCKTFGGKGYKVYANALPREDEDVFQFKKKLIEEGKMAAKGPQDPCGHRILEWLTEIKAPPVCPTADVCTCGQTPCICIKPPECTCGQTPCVCIKTEAITVEWTSVPEAVAPSSVPPEGVPADTEAVAAPRASAQGLSAPPPTPTPEPAPAT